jgi:A/G-specific adenine glycosylase
MHDFSLLIRLWYRQNARNLPWRDTKNPYFIWLSEIILQQTRVDQGMDYYKKFIKHFPTVNDLANADEQTVLNLWQGLGYYSRARNLHFAAQQVLEQFQGVFPSTYKDVKSLKGVGDYTAAAISSFAYNLPHAVLDGNVFRVLSRYFADETPIDSTQGKKLFQKYAQELLDQQLPAEHNQAIMEMGALICKPKNPNCSSCVLSESCLAFRNNNVQSYPVKSKKIKIRNRYFNYLVESDEYFKLEKRTEKGIWQNMYQFPLYETNDLIDFDELRNEVDIKYGVRLTKKLAEYKHILSHQKIHATFWSIDNRIGNNHDYINVDVANVDDYPLPRLVHRFLEDHNPKYGES